MVMAESMHINAYDSALQLLSELFEYQVVNTEDEEKVVSCLLSMSKAFMLLGQIEDARGFLQKTVDRIEKRHPSSVPSYILMEHAIYHEGLLEAHVGNYRRAAELFTR
jgi:hypothetical protein